MMIEDVFSNEKFFLPNDQAETARLHTQLGKSWLNLIDISMGLRYSPSLKQSLATLRGLVEQAIEDSCIEEYKSLEERDRAIKNLHQYAAEHRRLCAEHMANK
jgi:hypothetical protein